MLLAIIGTVDVLGTELFGTPLQSALEFTEAGLAVIVFMGLGLAQRNQAHVTVDILSAQFRGVLRAIAHGSALIAAIVVFGYLAWRSGIAASESWAIDERKMGGTNFPVYPGKTAVSLGCLIAMLESLRQFVHFIVGARSAPEDAKSGPSLPPSDP